MGQRVGRILFSLLGVAALAAAGLLVPHFLTPANLLNVVRQSSIIGIGAVGMTMGIGIFITQFTPTGNRIYALGGNETVVRQEGINVDGLKLFVYAFSGFCASIAGILLSAQLDTVHPIQGDPYLLDTIAACVIGGATRPRGGGPAARSDAGALRPVARGHDQGPPGVHPLFLTTPTWPLTPSSLLHPP